MRRVCEGLHRPGAGALALGAAGVLALGLAGRAALRLRTPASPYGSLTDLPDGARVHAIARHGTADGATVVFENALVCAGTEWLHVIGQLAPDRSCLAYDRPGTGWSPGGPDPARPETYPDVLRELLAVLELPPPYILVGHSVGGLLIRVFARRYPELVAGLVFVDASHPDQFERSRIQRDGMPWIRQRLAGNAVRSAFGLDGLGLSVSETAALPAEAAAATTAMFGRPGPWLGAYREARAVEGPWSEAARGLTSLPGAPVAVVTAGDTVARDPAHLVLQRELAGLSDHSRHDVVDEASHESLVMRPSHAAAVVAAIEWVEESRVRTGTPADRRTAP
ncbi:alpha/beta hydrolase [Kitasatospora sp. NPDC047058]|uniref:alpha/beta hydrolase n=1 Tax=Kitasatospora sp. NPDC047058 TaxID=3155620 RepID=UPI0033CF83C1